MLASVISEFTARLDDFASHWWFLAIIFAIAYLDAVIPIVPSETCVIIGGVAAAAADRAYPLPAVIAAGALGAFFGDNTAYLIGARFGPWVDRRAATRIKTQARLAWAAEQIRTRGGTLLITARFIPGGRTALTLASGLTRQSRRWFASWIAVAALIWATYASLLGFIGGRAFEDNHTGAFLAAFGGAVAITVVIEVVRYLRHTRAAAGR